MKISLNVNSSSNVVDLIKYCTLYFDKIEIDEPFCIDGVKAEGEVIEGKRETTISWIPSLSEEIRVMKNLLVEEGLCAEDSGYSILDMDGPYTKLTNEAKAFVGENMDLILADMKGVKMHKRGAALPSDKELSPEAKEVISSIITDDIRQSTLKNNPSFQHCTEVPDWYYAMSLYLGLVRSMLVHIEEGDNTLTNSDIVNQMLFRYYSKRKKGIQSTLKYNYAKVEATKILLPRFYNASLDDILNIRYKANDELLELRHYIDTSLGAIKEDIVAMPIEDIQSKLQQQLTPSIRAFERKVSGLNISTAQSFAANMMNPFAYAPLLTTYFTPYFDDTKKALAGGLSIAGIIGKTMLDRLAKKNVLQDDPLYFTVKLNEMV